MDLNNVSFTGRLTADSVFKDAGGYDLLEFSFACNGFKDTDTIFLKANVWGKTAKALKDYLKKGKQVALSGTLKSNEWTDKEGNKKQAWIVNTNSVAMIGGKEDSDKYSSERSKWSVPKEDSDVVF